MNKKIILAIAITLAIAGGAGFYGGISYGKRVSANLRANLNRQGAGFIAGMGQRDGGAQSNAGFSGGEIIKKDDISITVKLNNGGSQIILFSDATKIMKTVDGSVGDLSVGEQVTVSGSKNQDGSITAQSVQIRPVLPTSQ